MMASRVGDQLELGLFRGVPWEGHSPRGLTKAANVLYSRREPPGHEVAFCDPNQLELWYHFRPHRVKGSDRVSVGAPLLLPLPAVKARRI